MSALPLSTVKCVCVCACDEHLESFAANPSFPRRSLNRKDDMFSHPGCSCFILIANLTPEQRESEPLLAHLCSVLCCKGKELDVCAVCTTMAKVETEIWRHQLARVIVVVLRLLVKLKMHKFVFVYIIIMIIIITIVVITLPFGLKDTIWAGSSNVELSHCNCLCNTISICQ